MTGSSWSVIVLAMAFLTAGCIASVDDGAPDEADEAPTASVPGDEGARLVVEVTDPAARPVEDAEVTVETSRASTSARTDGTGQAHLADLEPGRGLVTVQAPGHQGRETTVELAAGQTVHRSLVLPPLPSERSHVQTFEFHGFFECSATYLIVAGDCLAAPRAVAQQAGLWPGTNATNARFTFPFPIHDGWRTIRIVQTWEDPTVGTGSMMRVNLEPVDPNGTEGHSPQYAEADGTSPIELTVERGELHANASSEEMLVPEQGGWLRTRTFHLGLAETHDPAGTGFLGVGAAVQQSFVVTVAVTYR